MVTYEVLLVGEKWASALMQVFSDGNALVSDDKHEFRVGDQSVTLKVTGDSGGQFEYAALKDKFFADAHAIVFCFATAEPASLQEVKDYFAREIRPRIAENVCRENVLTLLIGVNPNHSMTQEEIMEMEARGLHGNLTDHDIEQTAQELGIQKWFSYSRHSADDAKNIGQSIADECVARFGVSEPSSHSKKGKKCNVA